MRRRARGIVFGATILLLAGCGDGSGTADGTQAEEADSPPPESGATAAAPVSDLWLATLGEGQQGLPTIGAPENLTQRALYDNQPFFLPDGSGVLYTAGQEGGGTDIHLFDLESRESRALMRTTPEREYSPTPRPGGRVAVVRVEADGSTQRLWAFDMESGEEGDRAELLLPDLEPVGYHAWLDDDRVAAFVLGNPATLHLADVRTGSSQVVFEGIGPSIQKIPGQAAVSFVELGDGGTTWIRRLDPETGESTRIVEGVGGGSDHAWARGGVLLMASEGEIFGIRAGVDEVWESLGAVGPEGVIWSRMAVSPDGDRIVLVGGR